MISVIAAIGKNRELGKDNKLLWHIPEDLKRFKHLTTGHVVIMGRKTFESLGKPLPNRINIVVTRNVTFKVEGGITKPSLEQAIDWAKRLTRQDEIFVIGGGQIYQQALPLAHKLYLTVVNASFDADTFFPDYSMFTKKVFEERKRSEKYTYRFLELEK